MRNEDESEECDAVGIFNRDYMRSPSPGGQINPANWSAVTLIIAINLAVFLLWQVAGDTERFLAVHFRCSWTRLSEGYVWTLLTSVFSHKDLFHVAMNLMVLHFFGRRVEDWLGARAFWVFYLVSGAFASFVAAALQLVLWDSSLLGASGAVTAVLLVSVFREPRTTILLFAVIPLAAWLVAAISVAMDGVGLVTDLLRAEPPPPGEMHVAHGAHLAGAGFGALFYGAWMRGWLGWLGLRSGRSGRRRRRSANPTSWEFAPSPRDPGRSVEEEARLDALLRKVSEGGLDSLTPSEREFLITMSKKSRRP